jgi:phenylacetic acid degradation operon negative regulatory protein
MTSRSVSAWIDEFLADQTLRANSLIITIYGDAIAPHGGTVWLGSFIRLVEPLGLNQRMVRTSVFRLVRENWLVAEQQGRRSFYSLVAAGRRRFEHAYRRIYDAPQNDWNGEWQIVFIGLPTLSAQERDSVKHDLLWEGFGLIAPGVLAHPQADNVSVQQLLEEAQVRDKVVLMRAASVGGFSTRPVKELVAECWKLDTLAAHYNQFIARFSRVLRAFRATREPDPQQCFLVRTLLIHEYRRVLLRDPLLPAPLLPLGWPGGAARELTAQLYRLIYRDAEAHLLATLETGDGPLPEAAPYFYARFGGLLEPAQPLASV